MPRATAKTRCQELALTAQLSYNLQKVTLNLGNVVLIIIVITTALPERASFRSGFPRKEWPAGPGG